MVFVDAGANEIRDWLAGTAGVLAPSKIHIGTVTTTPLKTDTALATQIDTKAFSQTRTANKTVIYEVIYLTTEDNSNTITEAGVFNATPDMFNRFTHASIAKTSQIEIQYEITMRVKN